MKLYELMEKLEKLAPPELALSWDNPGLICGRRDKEVQRVLLALDADNEAVEKAVREGCDLLLTHHPMIFKAVQKVNDSTALGRKLLRLIQADICCYGMHTNFDAAPGCMADLVCDRMGMTKEGPMEPSVDGNGIPQSYGIGFVGRLSTPATAAALATRLKEQFSLNGAVFYDAGKPILRVAVCPGSGRGMLGLAEKLQADAFITGDMGHHDGIDALDDGISLIDAGHFGLEHLFTAFMAEFLRREAPDLTVLLEETDHRRFV